MQSTNEHRYVQAWIVVAAIAAVMLFTVACGGGGSSGKPAAQNATALQLPDRITISAVDESGTAGSGWAEAGYDDEGTDYSNEPKETWMRDTDALDLVNDILQVVDDSGYEEFVNEGPYRALVRPVDDDDQAQTGNSNTSANSEELMEIIVDVTRENNQSPMIVKVWVFEDDGPGGCSMLIRGYFEVTEGVSEEYPYGAMTAHFKAAALDENGDEIPGDPVFTLAMAVNAVNGQVVVQVIDIGEEDDGVNIYEWDRRARIIANDDLSAGKAYVYSGETDWETQQFEEETFYFAYNEDYFKFQEEQDLDATVLDKNSFSTQIYRYKLFEKETGAAVDMNSGFPLRLEDGEYAYVSYYGLWAPYGSEVNHGDQVVNPETDEEYEVFKVRGKLSRHTRDSIVLAELTGVEISVWDEGSDFVVAWNGVDTFEKLGEWDHENGMINYLPAPEPYAFANEWDGGWCEALSAWLPLGNLTPDNLDTVWFHIEETVTPAEASDVDLYYWGFALDVPITQEVIDNAELDMNDYWAGDPVEKVYSFDSENLVLRVDDLLGDPIVIDPEIDLDGSPFSNGYWIGPLTIDNSYTALDWWEAYEADEYYSWHTGHENWNQFATVMDGVGVCVEFDQPARLNYTHATENDINGDSSNNGVEFSLQYDGYSLQIPWHFDADLEDWMPAFNLVDGTIMTEGLPAVEYVVKGVEQEIVMDEVTDPQILLQLEVDLPIDDTVSAPSLTYNAGKTALVGAVPANAELKVIKGELLAID